MHVQNVDATRSADASLKSRWAGNLAPRSKEPLEAERLEPKPVLPDRNAVACLTHDMTIAPFS